MIFNRKNRRPEYFIFSVVVFFLFALILECKVNPVSAQSNEELLISFIDVGQGDSSLLSTSKDIDVLIDGGPSSAGQTVLSYILSQGIDDIEVVILSHQHADHIGGLIEVFESSIPIDLVLYNGNTCTTQTCFELWDAMSQRGISPSAVEEGDSFQWGSLSAFVLNPQDNSTGDENEDSVVMLIEFFSNEFLYTGDIGFSTEETLIEHGYLRSPIEILKVAHHGSAYSTSDNFLNVVNPLNAVISVGENSYGHPSVETISRLNDSGAMIYRTDINSNITFTYYQSDNDEILVYVPVVFIFESEPKPEPTPTWTHMPTLTYTPTPTTTPTITPTPTPTDPMPGENVQCETYGNAEICASVSDAHPQQHSYVTVYGRLMINNVGQQGKTMTSAWHYKTTTSYCDGITNSGGLASCEGFISRATIGYCVAIDVSIGAYNITTSFTPIE